MTIFRFSAVLVVLLCVGCAKDMPPRDTSLGAIVRLSDESAIEAAMSQWMRARMAHKGEMFRELSEAGFRQRVGDPSCDSFDWQGANWGEAYSRIVILSVCSHSAEVAATFMERQ